MIREVMEIKPEYELNSNIRCIEMHLEDKYGKQNVVLNSNIRCIEIADFWRILSEYVGWIVTLDVLK